MTKPPLFMPLALGACFLAGIGWTFAAGPPGYGGTALTLIPLLAFMYALYRSRRRPQP